MDKYDEAIACLRDNPNEIMDAWNHPLEHYAGCLFQYCTPSGGYVVTDGIHFASRCGCPVQVKGGSRAWTSELTDKIRNDPRIPYDAIAITADLSCLEAFAEIQREMDRTIRIKEEDHAPGDARTPDPVR